MVFYQNVASQHLPICRCGFRSALYCLLHKEAVCGECILQRHPCCLVRTYTNYIVDGTFEGPNRCHCCKVDFVIGEGEGEVRLGCLDVLHVKCLRELLNSCALRNAEFACPSCSHTIWPPKFIPNPRSSLYLRLQTVLTDIGFEGLVVEEPPSPLDSFRNIWREYHTMLIEQRDVRKAELAYVFLKQRMMRQNELQVKTDEHLVFLHIKLPDFRGTIFAHSGVTRAAYEFCKEIQPNMRIRWKRIRNV